MCAAAPRMTDQSTTRGPFDKMSRRRTKQEVQIPSTVAPATVDGICIYSESG